MARTKKPAGKKAGKAKQVQALSHAKTAARRNIPTAELASAAERMEEMDPVAPVRYPRPHPLSAGVVRERDEDLDPQIVWNGARIRLTKAQIEQLSETGEIEIGEAQLVWRGKDRQDWSDLVVNAPPLYIQEKVHPQAIVEDLVKRTRERRAAEEEDAQPSLFKDHFADFNGLDDPEKRTEFYQHSQHWSNRMILGDSLQVMASLAEREGLRGKVQCIYFDPPYGIKFNSNWQVSTRSRDVKDGKQTDISREPEQVKAFRDTWREGIHSYLTYLRDRLTVARDLLTESGSIFVQIGDENVHRVRGVLDEVFGAENFAAQIAFRTTSGAGSFAGGTDLLPAVNSYLIWYTKSKEAAKYRQIYRLKDLDGLGGSAYFRLQDAQGNRRNATSEELESTPEGARIFRADNLTSQTTRVGQTTVFPVRFDGKEFKPNKGGWKTNRAGMERVQKADRLIALGNTLSYVRFFNDFSVFSLVNQWDDTTTAGFGDPKLYVVQTNAKIVERCIQMTTDPGDLVLDPTCGSGTTATVAEQWGRRWITIDTSRVALALARTRLMSARYPYYLLADSKEGRAKEQEVTGKILAEVETHGDIRQGFVYERAPHITLKSIANNAEIDVIWETWQQTLEPVRAQLNKALGNTWEEWEIPREADNAWPDAAKKLHAAWWEARIERQRQIDASIAKAADVEYLYDRPYPDNSRVRVAGPFTVESLSPHRIVPSDEDELADTLAAQDGKRRRSCFSTPPTDFAEMVLEHLRTAGVTQVEKRDTIRFTALAGWPGEYICAEGHFLEGETQRRAGILVGPEYGTLTRGDLTAAAREANDARFDALIACAFAFDAHATELNKLGPLPILKAKMNPDLHMAGELKNTGKGNLFVVFGEPDIDILDQGDDTIALKINGIDVFDPNTGDIRSGDTKSIAAWFIDTDYNEESFFVRHAYFLGANDPYKALKTALRAEIDEDAWATLYRDTSRPFPRPREGRIAVKVINHFGDEVMKVFRL
jgi:adenine-specific DNA-methyltransferase